MEKRAIDWKTVAKLFGGGALIGGGAGAITSYMRHMDALKHELATQNNTSDDDDVLYVDVDKQRLQKKAADDSAAGSTFALGSLGALLGAWAAYNGVRRYYSNNRKQDLQGQLDNAQHLYVNNLRDSVAPGKQANFPALSVASGTVGLATLLTMLGTAAVANRTLNKQFPTLKSPDRDKPKRIVIRSKDNRPEEVEDDETVTPDGREAMLRTILQTPKAASAFPWEDVLSAVAQGRGPEIMQLCEGGLGDSVFDVCRGAALTKTASFDRTLAVTWLSHEPLVANTLEPYMAAAVVERGGLGLLKWASGFSQAAIYHAVKGVELSADITRRKSLESLNMQEVKSALVPEELMVARALQALLSDNQHKEGEDDLEPLRNQSSIQGKSKESHEPSGERPLPLVETHGQEADKFLAKYGPALQAAL